MLEPTGLKDFLSTWVLSGKTHECNDKMDTALNLYNGTAKEIYGLIESQLVKVESALSQFVSKCGDKLESKIETIEHAIDRMQTSVLESILVRLEPIQADLNQIIEGITNAETAAGTVAGTASATGTASVAATVNDSTDSQRSRPGLPEDEINNAMAFGNDPLLNSLGESEPLSSGSFYYGVVTFVDESPTINVVRSNQRPNVAGNAVQIGPFNSVESVETNYQRFLELYNAVADNPANRSVIDCIRNGSNVGQDSAVNRGSSNEGNILVSQIGRDSVSIQERIEREEMTDCEIPANTKWELSDCGKAELYQHLVDAFPTLAQISQYQSFDELIAQRINPIYTNKLALEREPNGSTSGS